MRRADPARPDRDGPVMHAGDPQLLESLDPAHDVHQRVERPHLVQSHRLGGHAVHLPLRLAHEPEGPGRALLDPGREGRALDDRQELPHVTVRTMHVAVTVRGPVRTVVIVLGVGGWGGDSWDGCAFR